MKFRMLLVLFLLGLAPAAHAQLFRAYLSTTGSDLANCTLPTPCRLLPAALAAVADGGEIWMLDSGNYNTGQVILTKSVTILAVPGAQGSLLGTGGNALRLDTAGLKVTLRNIAFGVATSGNIGIFVAQAQSLTVEGCSFANLSSAIHSSAPGLRLLVKDSTFVRHQQAITLQNSVDATFDRVLIANPGSRAMQIGGGARVLVSNSTLMGSSDVGIFVDLQSSSDSAFLLVDRSNIINHFGVGIYLFANQPGSLAHAVITRSTLSGNNHGAISNSAAGAQAIVLVDNSTVTNNAATGITRFDTGVLQSRQNSIFANTFNASHAPTPVAGQ